MEFVYKDETYSKELLESFKNHGENFHRYKELEWIDDHSNNILYTGLDTIPVSEDFDIPEIKQTVTAYSIFTRLKSQDSRDDSNPVLYALKGEKRWTFTSERNKQLFWNRFEELLEKFLFEHRGQFETTIVIPSSKRLNKDIVEAITSCASGAGITNVMNAGLHTIDADDVLLACEDEDSYFRKYWGRRFNEKVSLLEDFIDKMNVENNGIFKYHMIDSKSGLRQSIIHTLEVDKKDAYLYRDKINGKHVLLIDDSITYGQSIQNAVYALSQCYNPKTISVLTMFSKLQYDDTYRDYDAPYS